MQNEGMMMENKYIPLSVKRWRRLLFAVLLLGLSVWMNLVLGMMPDDNRAAKWFFCGATLLLAFACFAAAFSSAVLEEQGVNVKFLGVTIKRYPREKLKLMCCVWDRWLNQVCLCTVSEDRLAKRKPLKSTYRGYSHRYVGAEAVRMILMGKSRWAQMFPITGEALWLEWHSGLTEELKRLYPEVPWLDDITAG